jgi:hypothetical protein
MRSRSSRTQMSLAAVVCAGAVTTILAACNKPPTAAVFDAGPPPVATDAAPTILVPLDEGAGSTVDAAVAVVKHVGGPAVSSNQARAKQCCNALRTEAKTLGASPEANLLIGFAAQCDVVAMQIGPTSGGQAPEFAGIRQLLKGHNMPPVCSGL